MKNSRRLIAVVMIIFISFGCLSITASAAGTPNGNESMHVVVKTDVTIAYPGDYITVTLNVTNNYNATAMRFPVLFPADILEIDESNLNIQKLGQLTTVTGNLNANTGANPAFYPAGYSADDYGVVLVQWTGTANAGLFGCYNRPVGEDCISFQLKIKDNVDATGPILIPPESALFYYQAMNDPADGTTIYAMSAATCPLTFTSAQITAQYQAPDIMPFGGSDTVIDKSENLIYGLSTGLDSLDNHIVPVGGATLDVIKSSETICGTGTLVHVMINDSVYRTYTVVIFGDMNGDGNIDGIDAGSLVDYENHLISWSTPSEACYLKAGDVNGDGGIDSVDAGILIDAESLLRNINQVTGMAE
ncbi:MAG TPA: dockerin type I domain-containing protein [Clostridia bacterium]|nr:dockerin type I domain-containing protein [Clostridia bacterium]